MRGRKKSRLAHPLRKELGMAGEQDRTGKENYFIEKQLGITFPIMKNTEGKAPEWRDRRCMATRLVHRKEIEQAGLRSLKKASTMGL